MKVLDAYCCAGGIAAGYRAAGLNVVGVDIEPQPNYPFEFHRGDAIEFINQHGHEFDLIHMSPPCQDWSPLNAYNQKTYPRLIKASRVAAQSTGKPYVIENVAAAALELKDPVLLCGTMFNLRMYRHRLIETSFPLTAPKHPEHEWLCTRNGYLPTRERPFMTITGGKHSAAWQRAAALAMEMPWAKTIREVCEAVPPSYGKWIGEAFLRQAAETRKAKEAK